LKDWLHWLKSRLRGANNASFAALPCPKFQVAVVGDIHGRVDLLGKLLTKITDQAPQANLIFVGDYIDRGPDSRKTIDMLRALPGATCIRGNHETMLLEFLDTPIERGGRWLRNGGTETLASYGISLAEQSDRRQVLDASQKLHAVLSDGTEQWLRALPLHWRSGNLLITHAGPDPARPIDMQDDDAFLWGHSWFLRDSRSDGLWVAHGHWITDRANCADGRINVDTGAFHTGRLTCALIGTDGQVRFIQTH
jgi:serine/threonine protein phosphatase 1